MNCTIQLIDKTSAQFSDSLTAVNFVFFRRSHWVFYGYFQLEHFHFMLMHSLRLRGSSSIGLG